MASKKKHQNIFATADARLAEYEAKQKRQQAEKDRKRQDNKRALIAGVAVLVVAGLLQVAYFGFGPGKVSSTPTASASAAASATPSSSATSAASATPVASASAPANSSLVPSPALAKSKLWNGTMQLAGSTLGLQLDGAKAPQAVANFLSLANKGFFNGISCHRLTTAGIYVLQCGDPKGDGTGGPGYNWGPIENAPKDNVYKAGVLAMARVGGNASSMGSQFFIVYQDSTIPSDNVGGYTVFGKVTSGLNVVTAIAKGGVAGGGSDGKPALGAKLGAIVLK
jgi:peptidyl-prolyl cis-trans isomerase B (cyclophilin B)